MAQLKTIDLFAGIGGIRIGFENAGFETIYANDKDEKAALTYGANFGDIDVASLFDVVSERGMKRIPKKFDILTGGFPCQPFSVAGYKRGFADKGRGDLLFAVIEILKKRKPVAVFLENVKHLIHHDDERTYKRIEDEFRQAGYYIKGQVLNSMQFGNVPQARERIYIVAFRDPRKLMKFRFPDPLELTRKMSDILEKTVDPKYYYTPDDKFIYPKLKEAVKFRDRFYQYRRVYVRENSRKGTCPTLTASMGMGGHNVPIIRDLKGIRKLTPRECARLQGIPESFIFPEGMSDIHLYKQIGNSVSVPVVARVAENIRAALEA
ncbi:MAG: DNA (cytosine-5-)-methyltransferase [Candidatus Magasanikbacteria bacterium]|nr:DNA (cytosine-5-)-methyltransferase [Candidatus Magasanikbacteria bacterium]